nr:MAG TPA: hypothetical protein [Caudoviricetes sp.]
MRYTASIPYPTAASSRSREATCSASGRLGSCRSRT